MKQIQIKKSLWRYEAKTVSWYFVSVSTGEVESMLGHPIIRRAGWGQIRVIALIGDSLWNTSLFPYKEVGYILPIKASVRKAEQIEEGAEVLCALRSVA